MSLTDRGPEILEQIDRIVSDDGFDPGARGKDGQSVPAVDAQCTLRIPSITVGGEET